MSISANKPFRVILPPAAALAAVLGLSGLSGCVVTAPPPPPPAAREYAPPPPPPEAAPVADEAQGEETAMQTAEPPPPLPDYDQPPCPQDGYMWTPGYWRWDGAGYFWVPGTWVAPPRVGLLWTPGYWAFAGGVYVFHAGYWGPHVGFYGGVNYGHGYGGAGFAGGRWAGNRFAYNTNVTQVNTTVIHNTYNETVVNNITVNKVSYNGGTGGIRAVPSAKERVAAREMHVQATAAQHDHVQEAARNPAMFAKTNGGRPAIAATPRPAAFNGPGVARAQGAAPGQSMARPVAANAPPKGSPAKPVPGNTGHGVAPMQAGSPAHGAPGRPVAMNPVAGHPANNAAQPGGSHGSQGTKYQPVKNGQDKKPQHERKQDRAESGR